jgi:acetyl-CoA acyltransferase
VPSTGKTAQSLCGLAAKFCHVITSYTFSFQVEHVSHDQSLFLGVGLIAAGAYDVIVAGGVEFMSDVPIRLSRKLRSLLLRSNKAKTILQKLQLLSTLRPSYLIPEVIDFQML